MTCILADDEKECRAFTRPESGKMFMENFDPYVIIIYGGGPSLPNDFQKLKKMVNFEHKRTLTIGVNYHAVLLDPDLIVSMDMNCQDRIEQYRQCFGYLVSNKGFADIRIDDSPILDDSGAAAVWYACQTHAKRIYLCGFDCWQGKYGHWHSHGSWPPKAQNPKLKWVMDRWRKYKSHLKDGHRIRAVSGPLKDLFPYDKEKVK